MVDFTKCKGEGCCLKDQCYRYTAKASEWQSYFDPPQKGKKCEYFMEIKKVKKPKKSLDNNLGNMTIGDVII